MSILVRRWAVGEVGGDVQQPAAEQLELGCGQVTVEEGGLGPGDQVSGGQRELQPGLVDGEALGTGAGRSRSALPPSKRSTDNVRTGA